MAGSLDTIAKSIQDLGLQDKFDDALVLHTTDLTLAFSHQSPRLADEAAVNARFQAIVDDGTGRTIYNKWFSK